MLRSILALCLERASLAERVVTNELKVRMKLISVNVQTLGDSFDWLDSRLENERGALLLTGFGGAIRWVDEF